MAEDLDIEAMLEAPYKKKVIKILSSFSLEVKCIAYKIQLYLLVNI